MSEKIEINLGFRRRVIIHFFPRLLLSVNLLWRYTNINSLTNNFSLKFALSGIEWEACDKMFNEKIISGWGISGPFSTINNFPIFQFNFHSISSKTRARDAARMNARQNWIMNLSLKCIKMSFCVNSPAVVDARLNKQADEQLDEQIIIIFN